MKVVNFCHAVIASKNERKRIFAWQSIKYTFDNGLPHFALRLVRNDAEFMNLFEFSVNFVNFWLNFRAKFVNFRLTNKENNELTKRERERGILPKYPFADTIYKG